MSKLEFKIEDLIPAHIKKLEAYSSARAEFSGGKYIQLDANENSFGSVIGNSFNRYPDPNAEKLLDKIAKLQSIQKNQIMIGNGSDELIDLVLRCFTVARKDRVVVTTPSYDMYRVLAQIAQLEVVPVALNKNFDLDKKIVAKICSLKPKIIFLCSPNNPTGNNLSAKMIKEILRKSRSIVVVDQAYIDFDSSQSLINDLEKYDNLIIIRTFSKGWGLAALRCGFLIASNLIINNLRKIKMPYNVNQITQNLVYQALKRNIKKVKATKQIILERENLSRELKKCSSVIRVYKSNANFLLVKFSDAKFIYDLLKDNSIIVRRRDQIKGCLGCLRITVGTKAQNSRLIKIIKSV